jgi:hypothetical protein
MANSFTPGEWVRIDNARNRKYDIPEGIQYFQVTRWYEYSKLVVVKFNGIDFPFDEQDVKPADDYGLAHFFAEEICDGEI